MTVLVAALVLVACAAGASGLRLSLVNGPARAEVGRPVAAVVAATRAGKPVERGRVVVWIEQGRVRRSFATRAEPKGRYRAQIAFPSAGRWSFGARVGATRMRFRSVQVRRRATPLTFAWPTSIEVESSRSLLLVENGVGRVIRVDPGTGKTMRVASIERAYAVARTTAGSILVSAANTLRRIDDPTPLAEADADIGPIAIGPKGDVYYATATRVFRLSGGSRQPVVVAGTEAKLSGPHGLAVAADGAVLVCDTGNGRILRIDPASGAITPFTELGAPRGIDVAADGSLYVVAATARRVVHLSPTGSRLGIVGPTFGDPYDVEVAPDGVVYVLDTAAAGHLYRVNPNGTARVVSRR
jgi:sugar lactone lactonase YvrE